MAADPRYDEVLPANRAGATYGCHSREIPPGRRFYWATNRNIFPDGSYDLISVRVPVNFGTECRNFYLWDTDPRCAGCTTPKDLEFQQRMMGK